MKHPISFFPEPDLTPEEDRLHRIVRLTLLELQFEPMVPLLDGQGHEVDVSRSEIWYAELKDETVHFTAPRIRRTNLHLFRSLCDIEAWLQPPQFIRINQHVILNIAQIMHFEYDTEEITMKDEQ